MNRVVTVLEDLWSSPSTEVSITIPIFPPTITGSIPDLHGFKDMPITIKLTDYESDFSDADSNLRWTVENVSFAHISGINGQRSDDDVLTFIPSPGFLGRTTVTLVLTNSNGLTDSNAVTLTWAVQQTLGLFTREVTFEDPVYDIPYSFDLTIQNVGDFNLVLYPLPLKSGILKHSDSLIVEPSKTETFAFYIVPRVVSN